MLNQLILRHLCLTFLLIFPILCLSQSIEGYVFDEDGAVDGARIFNATKTYVTLSDEQGKYKIRAQMNDTLVVSSSFHEEKIVVVSAAFMQNDHFIQLDQKATELEEVEINVVIQRIFDSIAYQNQLNQQAKQKLGTQNVLKSGEFNQPTMNLLDLAEAIGVISKKNKNVSDHITYEALEDLFQKDAFFNATLLEDELRIPPKQANLFFEYCSVQQMDRSLLASDQKILLLDALENQALAFRALLEETKED